MKQMLQEFLMKGLELNQLSHLSDNSIVAQMQTDCVSYIFEFINVKIRKNPS